MKKTISIILLLCMALTFTACGNEQITMQEICDAGQTETLLQNHKSIYVQATVDGEFFSETYLTKEYLYEYFPDEEAGWAEFVADDANYFYFNGEYVRFLSITPDGLNNDFASYYEERYPSSVLGTETIRETIESVSKKDGHITVKSFCDQELLEDMAEDGVTSAKFEYTMDAKTHELLSVIGDYTFDDGATYHLVTEATYGAEAPEMVQTFLAYASQTEDLRNITVVTNPGTEKEISQSIQVPKGLIIGFRYDDAFENKFEIYADTASTKLYDPYEDTDSDITIYVKFSE